jgi:two-component system, sensor histidine kinase
MEGLKVLLAEDNIVNQKIAGFIFARLGVVFDIASNGQEAFEMYQQQQYDLILMDMQMPVMDGLEATRKIRLFEKASAHPHKTFIVALTANDISEKKQDCIESGMNDFMEKPFQEDVLRELFSRTYKISFGLR